MMCLYLFIALCLFRLYCYVINSDRDNSNDNQLRLSECNFTKEYLH